jgi:hypothetical protein
VFYLEGQQFGRLLRWQASAEKKKLDREEIPLSDADG